MLITFSLAHLSPEYSGYGRDRRMDEEVEYLPEQGLPKKMTEAVVT